MMRDNGEWCCQRIQPGDAARVGLSEDVQEVSGCVEKEVREVVSERLILGRGERKGRGEGEERTTGKDRNYNYSV